jgi:hypothetical protein
MAPTGETAQERDGVYGGGCFALLLLLLAVVVCGGEKKDRVRDGGI